MALCFNKLINILNFLNLNMEKIWIDVCAHKQKLLGVFNNFEDWKAILRPKHWRPAASAQT